MSQAFDSSLIFPIPIVCVSQLSRGLLACHMETEAASWCRGLPSVGPCTCGWGSRPQHRECLQLAGLLSWTHRHSLTRSSCVSRMSTSCVTQHRASLLVSRYLGERWGDDNKVAEWSWLADSGLGKKSLVVNLSHLKKMYIIQGWIIFIDCPFPRGQGYHPPCLSSDKVIDEIIS